MIEFLSIWYKNRIKIYCKKININILKSTDQRFTNINLIQKKNQIQIFSKTKPISTRSIMSLNILLSRDRNSSGSTNIYIVQPQTVSSRYGQSSICLYIKYYTRFYKKTHSGHGHSHYLQQDQNN